jgi:hypothetical protein
MRRHGQIAGLAVAAVVVTVLWVWSTRQTPQEREIRARVDEFTAAFNAAAGEGLGGLAHAARLGQFFTDDVVLELGHGSAPIQGRETVMGMAARLQPRTAEFLLEVVDVTVAPGGEGEAELSLTAVLRRRSGLPRGESLDARELAVEIERHAGAWQVSRLVAVDTLR